MNTNDMKVILDEIVSRCLIVNVKTSDHKLTLENVQLKKQSKDIYTVVIIDGAKSACMVIDHVKEFHGGGGKKNPTIYV